MVQRVYATCLGYIVAMYLASMGHWAGGQTSPQQQTPLPHPHHCPQPPFSLTPPHPARLTSPPFISIDFHWLFYIFLGFFWIFRCFLAVFNSQPVSQPKGTRVGGGGGEQGAQRGSVFGLSTLPLLLSPAIADCISENFSLP